MLKVLFLTLGLIQLVSCGQSDQSSFTKEDEAKPEGAAIVTKMKPYCESCHATGTPKKKFFVSKESPAEVWTYITTQKNPDGVLWLDAIVKVLEWPSNDVPAAEAKNADGKKYMPTGKPKREAITKMNPEIKMSDREWILKSLKAYQK